MLEVGELFLNTSEREEKAIFFVFWLRTHIAYKMNPIKIYREWLNLNTVQISFCKVAVTLIKFAIKDVKMTKKRQNMATLPMFKTL